jgi:hypothetical protein
MRKNAMKVIFSKSTRLIPTCNDEDIFVFNGTFIKEKKYGILIHK